MHIIFMETKIGKLTFSSHKYGDRMNKDTCHKYGADKLFNITGRFFLECSL